MFNTAYTFGLTQFARSLSLPERLQKRPFRNAALEPWRFRNSSLDAMYYDIKTLTADEAFYISDSIAAEGMLMIVPPTDQGMLILCDSVDEYLVRGGRDVHVMAVAGTGGSAAGAAAFARNVADAVDAPVAAVVSGYGLGDIISEAMGGNFLFGPLGFLRRNFEMVDDLVGRPHLGDFARHKTTANAPRKSSLDTDTVEALLRNDKLDFHLITGHSKGNLIIADALRALETDDPERLETLAKNLKLVSFATRIAVPASVKPALAIMGELDWYGELNATAPTQDIIRVPRCGHSTNSDMPGALKVTSLLRDALRETPKQDTDSAPEAPQTKKPAALHLVKTPAQPPLDTNTETENLESATVSAVEQPATPAAEDTLQADVIASEPKQGTETGPETGVETKQQEREQTIAEPQAAIEEKTVESVAEQKAKIEIEAQPEAPKKSVPAVKSRSQTRSRPRRPKKT